MAAADTPTPSQPDRAPSGAGADYTPAELAAAKAMYELRPAYMSTGPNAERWTWEKASPDSHAYHCANARAALKAAGPSVTVQGTDLDVAAFVSGVIETARAAQGPHTVVKAATLPPALSTTLATLCLATRRHTNDAADCYDHEREALLSVEEMLRRGVAAGGAAEPADAVEEAAKIADRHWDGMVVFEARGCSEISSQIRAAIRALSPDAAS